MGIWESDNEDDEPIMTQVIPETSVNLKEQMGDMKALQESGSIVSAPPMNSKNNKPSPPSSADGNSGQKKRQVKTRNHPDKDMRNRCKMVADWIEVMGPSAFTEIVGCDKEYLRALLRDKVNLTDTILDTK